MNEDTQRPLKEEYHTDTKNLLRNLLAVKCLLFSRYTLANMTITTIAPAHRAEPIPTQNKFPRSKLSADIFRDSKNASTPVRCTFSPVGQFSSSRRKAGGLNCPLKTAKYAKKPRYNECISASIMAMRGKNCTAESTKHGPEAPTALASVEMAPAEIVEPTEAMVVSVMIAFESVTSVGVR